MSFSKKFPVLFEAGKHIVEINFGPALENTEFSIDSFSREELSSLSRAEEAMVNKKILRNSLLKVGDVVREIPEQYKNEAIRLDEPVWFALLESVYEVGQWLGEALFQDEWPNIDSIFDRFYKGDLKLILFSSW